MLADRLREIRKQHGYSQQQVAKKLHLTQGAISQWENGITVPAAEQLVALSEIYGMSVDEILGVKKADAVSTAPWNPEDIAFAEIEDKTIRIMARGMSRIAPENRQTLLDVARAMYGKDFDEEGNKR